MRLHLKSDGEKSFETAMSYRLKKEGGGVNKLTNPTHLQNTFLVNKLFHQWQ